MTPTILILTQPEDIHASAVGGVLQRRGARVIEMHTAEFPALTKLATFAGNGGMMGQLELPNERVDLSQVTSVWYRRPERAELPDWPAAVRKFAVRESEHALGGLWAALDCYWVSRPERIFAASYKLPQLGWARAAGFRVPDTLVTNDPLSVRAFYDTHDGAIVYKTLYAGNIAHSADTIGVIYTTPILAEHVEQMNRVALVPCQFQEYVPKRLEVRATVMGEAVLAVEIHSQATEQTRHDWRRYDDNTPYQAHALPHEMEDACIRLVKQLGLEFGAIDLILRPDGEYVFLEINPNGQWLWLEPASGLPFTDTLADLLIERRALSSPAGPSTVAPRANISWHAPLPEGVWRSAEQGGPA
jgi:glutathione synthase/RimK-type ligase-like ATP-grasp enzyme